jgi:hypothetical protein
MGITPSGRSPSRVRPGASLPSSTLTSSATAAPIGTTRAAASLRLDLNQRITAALGDLSHLVDRVPASPAAVGIRISVRRPEDFLVFDLIFHGLALRQDPPRLERISAPGQPSQAVIVVEFPPQSFGEEAYLEVAGAEEISPSDDEPQEVTTRAGYPPKNVPKAGEAVPDTLATVRIRMAGSSRIAVSMPADVTTIRNDLASVLAALRDWPMKLDVNASPDPPRIRFDHEWLNSVVGTPAWSALGSQAAIALGAEDQQLTGALEAASQRLADRTLAGLATNSGTEAGRRPTEDLNSVLLHDLVTEISGLQRQFPALRDPAKQAAGITALSLAALQKVARSDVAVDPGVSLVSHVPFLPLLFAPHEPAPGVTALELPYRILLSPIGEARWQHPDLPVTHRDRTELWHTRLTTSSAPTGPDAPSRVRALWSPDYRADLDDAIALLESSNLIRMSLDPVDRSMLVTLMSDFTAKSDRDGAYQPLSAEAKRLHLSALGALLDAEGSWSSLPQDVDLQQWRHQTTLGRDHYVRVMYAGYLCPFGHAASLVKVTERKFETIAAGGEDNPGGNRIAVLRQRFFIVVREPIRSYTGANHVNHGNNFPFKQIEILTHVTPDLTQPGVGKSRVDQVPWPLPSPSPFDPYVGILPRMLFWPMVAAVNSDDMADFSFEIAAIDIDNKRSTFAMPLLFVGKLADEKDSVALKLAYNIAADARRRADLGAAVVTYAPFQAATDKGDTRLPTATITFHAGDLSQVAKPNYYPEVDRARVGIKPIQKLLAQPNFLAEVTYPAFYKSDGFNPAVNAGQVFLQLTQSKPLTFGGAPGQAKSDALGALASPQMDLLGLSKVMGPVAGKAGTDVDQIKQSLLGAAGGGFSPAIFFNGATILGGIKLGDILVDVADLAGADVPKMLARDFPDRVESSFDWETEIKQSDPLKLLMPNADGGKPNTMLTMHGVIRTPLDPTQAPSFDAAAGLNNFKVNLFGFIILWFEQLTFKAKSGQKPDVAVDLRQGDEAVSFGGPLEFVNELRKFIPANGFSDPPSLAVTPSGISAAFSLNLPGIGVGVFSLTNASLGAGFNLPFDSKPASVKFNFSERDHPFSLTVSLLGGGGFFAIGVSTRGVNEIEAALEFGAAIAIDLGVASGGVEVKAGIYFHWLEPIPDQGSIDLAGYVRIHGELSVLSIISVSLTFNLQLGYHKDPGKAVVYGEATLTVEIDILMFSADVSVSCRREFAGGAADPRFIDLVPTQEIWDAYCGAFAEEAA